MKFNFLNLKGRIVSKFGNQLNFANALGIPVSRVSKVLNNKAFLSAPEIVRWGNLLDIEPVEYSYYFFYL